MAKVRRNLNLFDGASDWLTPVTGALVNHRGGARTAAIAAPGKCGIMKDIANFDATAAVGATDKSTIEGWFSIRDFADSSAAGLSWIFEGGASSYLFGWRGTDRQVRLNNSSIGNHDTGYILEPGVDYYAILGVINRVQGDFATDWGAWIMPRGGAMVELFTETAVVRALCTSWRLRNTTNNASRPWYGKVSALGRYDFATLAEAGTYPADIIEPPVGLYQVFNGVGTSQGSGSSDDPKPLDSTIIADEAKYAWGKTDTIIIDTRQGAWDVGPSQVPFDLRGASDLAMYLMWTDPLTVKLHVDVTNSTWVNESGDIWSITPSEQKAILWEDGKKLVHPVGANFAAVSATMQATPGSNWTDSAGTKTYYVPTDRSNPNNRLHKLHRSRYRAGLQTFLFSHVKNLNLYDLAGDYTATVGSANNEDIDSGALVSIVSGDGFMNLWRPRANWWGKHGISRGSALDDGATAFNVRRYQPLYGEGHPYATGVTADVDQPLDHSTTQTAEYYDPVCLDANPTHAFYTSHLAFADGPMAAVTMNNVQTSLSLSNQNAIINWTINRGTVGYLNNIAGANPVALTVNHGTVITGLIAGTNVTLNRGVVWVPDAAVPLQTGNINQQISGGYFRAYGVTLDFSQAIVGDATASMLYDTSGGTATFEFGGCIGLFGGKDIALVANAAVGKVNTDDCIWERPVGSRHLENFAGADRTGTQWKALGFDTNSQFVTNAGAPSKGFYHLLPNSIARDVVSLARWPQLVNQPDFRGRKGKAAGFISAGAFEFQPNNSTNRMQALTAGVMP